MRNRLALALLVLSSSLPAVAIAQAPPITTSDGRIEKLKPGEYLWAPAIAPAGPVTVIVSLKTQKAYAYRNGVVIGVSTVSTGTRGYATPTGVFTVLQKDADHVSNLYKDAAMPFMQRLTWGASRCMRATFPAIRHPMAAFACRWHLRSCYSGSPGWASPWSSRRMRSCRLSSPCRAF